MWSLYHPYAILCLILYHFKKVLDDDIDDDEAKDGIQIDVMIEQQGGMMIIKDILI